MADAFDFKEQARTLLKRLGQNPGAPMNQGLALAAVEAALREAHARGMQDAKGPALKSSPQVAKKPTPASTETASEIQCAHEWEETFLDGRAVGGKCLHCGVLQRDVQERCNHFFVQVGGREICVACRKPKR
ncbi:MAG: hypothetical protein NDJ89_16005 [Oligoflexia bacterium]|nr:hypothetical protein [Oligoflexia bacterium]